MAKKDKKNKKAADNSWENEVDTAPPAEAVNAPAPVIEAEPEPEEKPTPPTASAEDDFMSGGLLGAIRKNAGKKKKKGKQVNDEEEEKPAPEEPTKEPTADYEAQAPVAVTEIDDDEFGPIKKGKKAGKQQQQQAKPASPVPKEAEEEDAGGADGDGEVRVKSKKEKEKEKKEKEKQKKKEAVCALELHPTQLHTLRLTRRYAIRLRETKLKPLRPKKRQLRRQRK